MQHIQDNQRFSTRRLEAMTDGVFGIAMTLLVLDLNVKELGRAATNDQLWQALQNMQTSVTSFIVSFLLLGSMWAVHVRQFEYIKQADRRLTMINTLRLLVVVLIPFTTSLAGAYPDLILGRTLFPLNFFLLAIMGFWQWDYATRQDKKLASNLSQEEIERGRQRNLVFVVMTLLVVLLSVFIGLWAFILFMAVGPVMMLIAGHVKEEG